MSLWIQAVNPAQQTAEFEFSPRHHAFQVAQVDTSKPELEQQVISATRVFQIADFSALIDASIADSTKFIVFRGRAGAKWFAEFRGRVDLIPDARADIVDNEVRVSFFLVCPVESFAPLREIELDEWEDYSFALLDEPFPDELKPGALEQTDQRFWEPLIGVSPRSECVSMMWEGRWPLHCLYMDSPERLCAGLEAHPSIRLLDGYADIKDADVWGEGDFAGTLFLKNRPPFATESKPEPHRAERR